MARKKTINLAVPEPLLGEFNEICAHYGHAKQKGLVLSAAMLMFLEADPADQGKALERIMIADVRNGVESLIERARAEQTRRVEARQDAEQQAGQQAGGEAEPEPGTNHQPHPAAPPPLARAAKKAGRSRKAVRETPDPPSATDPNTRSS